MRFAVCVSGADETSVGGGGGVVDGESAWDGLRRDTIFLLTVCFAGVIFALFVMSYVMEVFALKRGRYRRESASALRCGCARRLASPDRTAGTCVLGNGGFCRERWSCVRELLH